MTKTWRTCDLKTVAVLLYSGFKVANYGREGKSVFFDFEDTVDRKSKVDSFWNKELKVEPLEFLGSLNHARDMVTIALKV